MSAQGPGQPREDDGSTSCEHPFSATPDADCQFVFEETGSAAVLAARATASVLCSRRSGRHNRISAQNEFPQLSTYPGCARFKFGDGRLGEVRCAADNPVGIAGTTGKLTAFATEADIPALLRRGV